MSNPLTWPEIGHMADYYRSILDAHIRFREGEEYDRTKRPPLSKEQLCDLIFGNPVWHANIKYDGTNLALSHEGRMYGRRQEVVNPSYQKCSVAELRGAHDISAVAKELVQDQMESVLRFFVYGELVINNMYDYNDLNIFKTWLAFGVCMDIRGVEEAQALYDRLIAEGYRMNSFPQISEGTSSIKLTILLNHKLRDLLKSHQIPVADSLFSDGTLYEMVTQCGTWMKEGRGEGLVCVGPSFQRKWKIGLEAQPSVFEELQSCLETLSAWEDIDPRIVEAGQVMMDVKKSSLMMGKHVEPKKKKKSKVKTAPASVFDASQLEAAIDSALTKYDSLETFFAEDRMKEISTLVIGEAEHDLMPLTTEENAANAKKEICDAVRKFIGRKYGQWKHNRP